MIRRRKTTTRRMKPALGRTINEDKAYKYKLTGSQQQGTIVILISVSGSLSITTVVLAQLETPASRDQRTVDTRAMFTKATTKRNKADNKLLKGTSASEYQSSALV